VLERLRADGFDVEPLWREPGGSPSERLCQLIPPEQRRLYSIASAAPEKPAETLELAVGSLRYAAAPPPPAPAAEGTRAEPASPQLRRGTASSFLARAGRERMQVPFGIERPARFRLPADPRTPIVFFAGGTGLAPFLAFLRERSKTPGAGRCWLFWSVREAAELGRVEAELYAAVRTGLLELSVCFTREQVELIDDAERGKAVVPGPSRRITDLVLAAAPRLVELFRPEPAGGLGGAAYVCGSGGFARSVLDVLGRVLRMGSSEPSHQLESLLANQRLWLELHSEAPPRSEAERWIDGSEVAQRHSPERGYWMIIDGDVYDLTEFVKLHPGGERIVRAYAGMDGTHGYNRAHEARPEVDALRALYRIGRLRTLELDARPVEVKTPSETHHVSCRTAHRAWMQALHLVVEMQNALAADYSLQEGITTLGELAAARSSYKLSRAAETHYRFLEHYQRVLEGETLPRLWRITQALFAPDASSEWMEEALLDLRASRAARDAEALGRDLYERFAEHAREPARLARRLELLRAADTRLLTELEAALLDGVRAFERHEQRVRTSGMAEIWQACHDLASAFSTRVEWLTRRLAAPPSTPPPADAALDALALPAPLYSSEYWRLEAEPEQGLATLRRTPVPWPSLTLLASEIESLLGTLQPHQQTLGLLVDMRLAPLRNDSGFENAMAPLRQRLCGHFARTAVLLDSDVGSLAAARLERDERRHALCTRSESTARKFLMGGK